MSSNQPPSDFGRPRSESHWIISRSPSRRGGHEKRKKGSFMVSIEPWLFAACVWKRSVSRCLRISHSMFMCVCRWIGVEGRLGGRPIMGVNQRGRPMVLLPRMKAQNTKSGQGRPRF